MTIFSFMQAIYMYTENKLYLWQQTKKYHFLFNALKDWEKLKVTRGVGS